MATSVIKTSVIALFTIAFSAASLFSAEIHSYSSEFTVNDYMDFLWRFVKDVKFDDDRLFVLKKNGLEIYESGVDLRDPVLTSRLSLENQYTDIVVDDSVIALIGSQNDILLLDVSSPYTPEISGTIKFENAVPGIFISDSLMYTCHGFYGLNIIDISDPQEPEFVKNIDDAIHTAAVVQRGDVLYVADDYNGILIYDITDRFAPDYVRIEYLSEPGRDLALSPNEDTLYVAYGNAGVLVMDLTDPLYPAIVDTCLLANHVMEVAATSGYVAAVDQQSNVHVFDTKDAEKIYTTHIPNIGGHLDLELINGRAHLMLPNEDGDLIIVSLSDDSEPIMVWDHPGSELIRSVAFVDSAIAVAGGYKDLTLWRINEENQAEMAGSVSATIRHSEVMPFENALIVTENTLPDNSWMRFLNILPECCSLQVSSRHLAFPHVEGMQYDISDSGLVDFATYGMGGATLLKLELIVEPDITYYVARAVTYLELNISQTALDIANGYLYTYVQKGRGTVYNANFQNNYEMLEEVGVFSADGSVYAIEIIDTLCFIGGGAGLSIRNMNGPLPGETISSAFEGFIVTDFVCDYDRELVFATLGEDGVGVVDIADLTEPVLLARIETPGYADQLEVREDRIAVADRYSVSVIDFLFDRAEGNPIIPSSFSLGQNYPNPFNNRTKIEFSVEGKTGETKPVVIEVINTIGQVVTTIHEGLISTGSYVVHWDGTNSNGERVASGVYLYRLKVGDRSAVRKMVYLK